MRRINNATPKQSWVEKAISTHRYHVEKLKHHPSWTITDTATSLNRSIGSISEDLLLANWIRTHENKIRKFSYAKDALSFIRAEKRKIATEHL